MDGYDRIRRDDVAKIYDMYYDMFSSGKFSGIFIWTINRTSHICFFFLKPNQPASIEILHQKPNRLIGSVDFVRSANFCLLLLISIWLVKCDKWWPRTKASKAKCTSCTSKAIWCKTLQRSSKLSQWSILVSMITRIMDCTPAKEA